MYDAFIIFVLPTVWILLNVSSFLIIFIHELSHALPALLFTKQEVTIFIGFYGDKNSPKFKLGRLTIHIRPKFNYLKNRGTCMQSNDCSFFKQLIILVFAPIVVLALIILLASFIVVSDYNMYIKIVAGIFMVSAMINFLVNLFPQKIRIKNYERQFYTEGYLLILLWENKRNYNILISACRYYDAHDHKKALVYLNKVAEKYFDESIFSMKLNSFVQLGNYGLAKKLYKKYRKTDLYRKINSDDYGNIGYSDIQLKHYHEALLHLNRAIKLNPNKAKNLNNRGYVHNILGDFKSAKEDLNSAIFINENAANYYCNRAYSNLMMNYHGEAFSDVEKAVQVEPNNPYPRIALGIHFFYAENYPQALKNFERAKQLSEEESIADKYINEAKARLALKVRTPRTKKQAEES
jgi:tetratricopeptide (TPR) repeat protein